ncbi:hypothetical protein GJ496_007245 [Pomphorhynchus laevis]|nr:hypothetical protein GJ496_007245 [Pomphorhynchus laevis]
MPTSFDHVDEEFSVDVPESANALATASSQSMDKAHALKSQELDNSLYISKLADINNKSSLQLTSNHTTTRQSASKSSAVRYFCKQLNSILDSKPPISRAKVQSITKSALAAAIYYKHVVCNIEKFIQRCKNEYKLSGIYLIDSIVRQSRHECGNLKDPFGPRFSRNIENSFKCMHECTLDDKRKVLRLLSLWQRGAVFPDEKINFLSKIIVDLCSTSLLDDSAVFVDTPDDDNLKRKDSNRGDGRYLLSKDRLSLKTKTQSRQSSTTDKETLKDCDESNDDDDKVQELDDALTSLHHAKKSGIDIKSLLVGKDGKLRNIDSSLIRQIHKLTAQLLNNEDVNPAKRRLDNSSPTTEQTKTKNHKNSSYDDIQIYNNVKRRDEFDRQGSGPMGCSNFIQNQSQLHPSNSNYFGSISLSTHQPSLICAEDTDSMMIPSAQLNQQQMITDMRQQYQNAFPQHPQTFSNAFVQYQHYFPQRLESNELVLTVDGNLQQQPQMQLTTSSDIIDMRTLTSQPLNPYIAAAAFDSNQIPTLNHSVAAAAGFAQSTAITNNMSHIIHDRQQPLYQPINYAQSAGPLPPQSAIFPNDKDRISYNIMASQANSMQNQPNDMHASLSRIDADMFGNAHPNFAKASQLQYDFSQPPPNFIIKQPSQQYQHSENINEMNFNDGNNIVQQTNFKTDGTANRLTSKPLLPTPNFAHNILTVSTSSAADQNSAVNYKQTDIISDQMFHSAHPSSNMIASFQQNNKSCGATSAVNTSIVSHQQVFASSDDRQSDLMTIPDKDERQAVKNPAHLHAFLPEKQSVVESTEFTTNKVPDTAATIYEDHVSTINNNLAKDDNIHCSSTMLARSSSEFKTKPSHEKTSVLPMTNSSLRSSYNVPEQIIQPSNSTSWIDNQQIQHCNINNTLCNDERPRRLSLNQRIEAAVRSQQRNTTSSRKSHKSLFKDRSSERSTRKERGRTANSSNVISSYLTDDSRHHHYRKSINNESPPRAPISDLVQQFPAYDKDERHNHQHHHQHNHKHIRDERIRVDRSNQDNRHIRDDRAVCEQYTTPHEQSSDEHMSQNRHGDDDDERSVVEKQGGHQRIHQNERYNEDSSVDHHKEQPAFTDLRRSPTAEAQNRSVIRRCV